MNDITDKISELLSDPDGLEKIKAVAGALFNDAPSTDNQTKVTQQNNSSLGDSLSGILSSLGSGDNNSFNMPEGFDPIKLMGLMSVLGKKGDDKRTGLLLALKPHLSKERQERVDKAVKYLKIAAILPLLKEQGLFDIL